MNTNDDVNSGRKRPEDGPTEISELWSRFRKSRTGPLWTALLEHYLWIPRDEARSFIARIPRGVVEFDELLSEGVIGLAAAVTRFDPCSGTWFPAFARPHVRGKIQDRLRKCDPLPKPWRRKLNEVETAVQLLKGRLGAEPSPAQVCRLLGIELGEYHRRCRYRLLEGPVSLEAVTEPDDEGAEERRAAYPVELSTPPPDGSPPRHHLLALVSLEVGRLPTPMPLLLSLRFLEELTRVEAGVVLDLAEHRVRTLEMRATRRLRARLTARLPGRF